ncbi:MAG: hypothetical protein SynsKO_42330 [Synoicihabitans sp.]
MDEALKQTTNTKNKHMKKKPIYVGLDVHKDTFFTITLAEGGRREEIRHYGTISPDLQTGERTLRKIRGETGAGKRRHVLRGCCPTTEDQNEKLSVTDVSLPTKKSEGTQKLPSTQ